jgi:plasmid maintenance system antidote protein VapI
MVGKIQSEKDLIAKRITEILEIIELEPEGLAEFLKMDVTSLKEVISRRNGTTKKRLERLVSGYSITLEQFLDPNFDLAGNMRKSKEMKAFLKENKRVKTYFKATHSRALPSWYIKKHIFDTGFLNKPMTTGDIFAECKRLKSGLVMKDVNNAMTYMVKSGQIIGKQMPIVKKDGTKGERLIWYFWRK